MKKFSIGYLMSAAVVGMSLVVGVSISLNLFAEDGKVNVTRVVGSAAVWSDADGRWEAVTRDRKLSSGQQIRTAERSSVELVTPQNHKVKIDENSRVVVDEMTENSSVFSVAVGKIRSWVKKLRPADKYQVKTPISVISVRGTDFSVAVDETNKVRVECYEGLVAAREDETGAEVEIAKGQATTIEHGVPPAPPENITPSPSEKGASPESKKPSEMTQGDDEARAAITREMFEEISKEAVMERAAEELKTAEYQNGKSLVDARGLRVRLEEYIVRSQPNQFKYVVLNTREKRFDFGKILFTFNSDLPSDLSQVTKNMFHYSGSQKPSVYLTGVDSVVSNTKDSVNEVVSNCDMVPDDIRDPEEWNLAIGKYEFYVNNTRRWKYEDINGDHSAGANEFLFYDASGGIISAPTSELKMPSGPTAFHFYQKNTYSDGFWIATNDYIINDDGKIQTLADIMNKKPSELNDYLYRLNFQREYTSSAFTNQDARNADGNPSIDLVYSAKLLVDSGMLSLPNPRNFAQAISY